MSHNSVDDDESQLKVSFRIQGGRLAVDRGHSTFNPTPAFISASKIKDPEKIRKMLLDDLDQVLSRKAPLYWYSFNQNTISANYTEANNKKGSCKDDSTPLERVQECSTTWQDYKDNIYPKWAITNAAADGALPDNFKIGPVFSKFINLFDVFNDIIDGTAISYDTSDPETFSLSDGTITFTVSPPIGDIKTSDTVQIVLRCSTDKKAETRIRNYLGALKGSLWRPATIRNYVEDYYTGMGLQPTVEISGSNEDERRITIQESPRLGRVVFSAEDIDKDKKGNTLKALSRILSDNEFSNYLKNPVLISSSGSVGGTSGAGSQSQVPTFRSVDFTSLGHKAGEEPYLNILELQRQQLSLSQLGYKLVPVPNGQPGRAQQCYYDLRVVKDAEDEQPSKGTQDEGVKQAAPLATEEGLINPQLQTKQPQTDFVPKRVQTSTTKLLAKDERVAGEKRKRNYLGFGLDYRPGQRVRLFGLAQRSGFGPGDISVKFGEDVKALGAINYFADFVAFSTLHKRLSLQLTGSSDFQARRIFSGLPTDERRTGGSGRAELELFHDRDGHALRFYAEGRSQTVELLRSDTTVGKQNLTTLDVGSLYLFERYETRYATRLLLEPRIRFGLGLAKGEPAFTAFRITGNFHQQMPRLFEADISGRFETASAQTPLFEQPSFGGADVVRGFRTDDAIGRRLWSFQNEIWAPLPGTGQPVDKLHRLLRRNVRLAGFLDVGRVDMTTGSRGGLRLGPGVGARFIYNPVIFKLDWAYGLRDPNGHGRFYFAVSTNLPF